MFKINSTSSKLLKGGETMKHFGLVLALSVVVAGGAYAEDSCKIDIYSGWNQISVPLVQTSPDPTVVFNGVSVYNSLQRYDATVGTYVLLDDISPELFGNVLLGEGYVLAGTEAKEVTVSSPILDGVPDTQNNKTDMWISLPGVQSSAAAGGWHLIGHPFNHITKVSKTDGTGDNISFTDGTTMKTWKEAAEANWVSGVALGLDSTTQTNFTVGFDLADSDQFEPGRAYWIGTYKSNLAMIINAN